MNDLVVILLKRLRTPRDPELGCSSDGTSTRCVESSRLAFQTAIPADVELTAI